VGVNEASILLMVSSPVSDESSTADACALIV